MVLAIFGAVALAVMIAAFVLIRKKDKGQE